MPPAQTARRAVGPQRLWVVITPQCTDPNRLQRLGCEGDHRHDQSPWRTPRAEAIIAVEGTCAPSSAGSSSSSSRSTA